MSRLKYLLPISLILFALVATIALSKDPPAAPKTTVGEFALKVLNGADYESPSHKPMTAEQAVDILKKAGLKLKGSVNDPLAEGDKSAYALAVASGLLDRLSLPPEGFEACAGLPSVPQCHACCQGLAGATNKSCGKACGQDHANQQHASGSEPTP